MKKLSVMMLTGTMLLGAAMMGGCGAGENKEAAVETTNETAEAAVEEAAEPAAVENTTDETVAENGTGDFDTSEYISVVSREDGSGTRGAFIELFGIEEKNEAGEKIDYTTEEAIITNSTDVMMTTVAGDEYAIGYCSLGSLNDTVKAVTIDGAEATVENIKSGTYAISRPFNIVTQDSVSAAAQDFINYILSADGQAVVNEKGYISVADDAESFTSDNSEGKIVIAGSSSVTPVMEKLKEAYEEVNTNVEIEIQESDSTTGVTAAIDGTCDIGMASRDLKEEETGVTATKIALDGIAVIVNNNSPVEDLSKDMVKSIFKGESTVWNEVIE